MSTPDYDVQLSELKAELTKLRADFKKLKKQVSKLSKDPEEDAKERPPSGFAKPMKLSAELTKFLEIDADSMMARTEVTKAINKYVKENNLQNPQNKRELILDEKLKTIIKAQNGETVTFFNLQRFMSPHYIKDASAPVPADKIKVEDVEDVENVENVEKAEEVSEAVEPKAEPKKVKKIIKKVNGKK